MTNTDSIENYREVTASEKAKLEEEAATWERPPQYLIDMFNDDPHGCYNEDTGYFELNGLTDITTRQAKDIAYYGHAVINSGACYALNWNSTSSPHIRTNLTPINGNAVSCANPTSLCCNQTKLEVFRISETAQYGDTGDLKFNTGMIMFSSCSKLHSIIGGRIVWQGGYLETPFSGCTSLRDVQILSLPKSLDIRDCKSLSYDSIKYMVDNANNKTNAITITVHADLYAKLTGNTTNQAAASLAPEELEQWQALVPLAAEKNITFVTA